MLHFDATVRDRSIEQGRSRCVGIDEQYPPPNTPPRGSPTDRTPRRTCDRNRYSGLSCLGRVPYRRFHPRTNTRARHTQQESAFPRAVGGRGRAGVRAGRIRSWIPAHPGLVQLDHPCRDSGRTLARASASRDTTGARRRDVRPHSGARRPASPVDEAHSDSGLDRCNPEAVRQPRRALRPRTGPCMAGAPEVPCQSAVFRDCRPPDHMVRMGQAGARRGVFDRAHSHHRHPARRRRPAVAPPSRSRQARRRRRARCECCSSEATCDERAATS